MINKQTKTGKRNEKHKVTKKLKIQKEIGRDTNKKEKTERDTQYVYLREKERKKENVCVCVCVFVEAGIPY